MAERQGTDNLAAAVEAMLAEHHTDRTHVFTRRRAEKLRLRRELAAARDAGLRHRHATKTSTTDNTPGREP